MTRPLPARAGDVIPQPAEFAGWPPLGVHSWTLDAGGVRVVLQHVDAEVAASLARWAGEFAMSGTPGSVADVVIECAGTERTSFLAPPPAEDPRTRLLVWREGTGHAMVTHHSALLLDEGATRGILLLARADRSALDRALQNALRVVTAWHLGVASRGLMVHAAAVEVRGAAVLFVGASGAGKSTACRLASPWPVLADDVAVLSRSQGPCSGGWSFQPSPLWAESEFPRRNHDRRARPLAGIVRLQKSADPGVAPLLRPRAAALLAAHAPFASAFDPSGPAADIALAVDAHVLSFARESSVSELLAPHLADEGFPPAPPARCHAGSKESFS